MSAIDERLVQLNDSVIELEKVAEAALRNARDSQAKLQDRQKKPAKAGEPDLFTASFPANRNNAVGPLAYDPKLAVRKIDMLIAQTEKAIREG